MATISELKTMLKARGLPVSGTKAELTARLMSSKSASIKSKKQAVKKIRLNFEELNKHPLAVFYITLYFQNPKSNMAKNWLKTQGINHATAKHFYDKIMKK